MTSPSTPSPARIPLPPSRLPSPTSHPSRSRDTLAPLNLRRNFPAHSPLRSTSLPLPDDTPGSESLGNREDDEGLHDLEGLESVVDVRPPSRPPSGACSPVSSNDRGRHNLKRPMILRSSTSTQTVVRATTSSVPPPLSSRRTSRKWDYEQMMAEEAQREEREQEDDFYKERSLVVNEPVGSLSISPSSRDVCLASRKGLFILDMQVPDQAPRWVPQGGTWQVADCQWSPHPATSNLILTTSSQKLLLWDLCSTSPSTCLSRIISAHERSITDINWHARNPNFMATTSIDGSVKGWDIRVKDNDRAVVRLADWGDAATQVKWNRQHDHILASSHGNRLCIWDTRKGAIPITSFQAHDDRIYGIDWDRRTRHQITTCSLDKTIKYWTIDDLSDDHENRYQRNVYFPSLPAPKAPSSVIHTKNPVWRARNLPFGRGVLSLPQRGTSALEMWGKNQGSGPIERFEEYDAPVKEFVWRTRGGHDADYEDREFQLITWSKDRRLRMIPVQRDVLARAGYRKGAPIDLLVSRRNAPDISYATWDPPEPPSLSASLMLGGQSTNGCSTIAKPSPVSAEFPRDGRGRIMSMRAHLDSKGSSALNLKPKWKTDLVITKPAKAAVMTRGPVGKGNKRRKVIDQLEWLNGVSTIRREGKTRSSFDSSMHASQRTSRFQSLSRKGSDSGTHSLEGFPMTPGNPMSFSIKGLNTERRGSAQLDFEDDEKANMDLADEIRQVKVAFPRAKFESQNLDFRKRQCAVSLKGPWGEGARMVYTRILFRFPAGYPRKTGPSGCPAFKLIERPEIAPATHETLKRRLHEICNEQRPSLAACISYLLGHDERKARVDVIDADSDSESDIDMQKEFNVPSKRTCGMSWGPNGELVVFRTKEEPQSGRRIPSLSRSPSGNNGNNTLSVNNAKSNTVLLKAMSALSRLSNLKNNKSRKRQAELAGFSFAAGIRKTQLITADGSLHHTNVKPQNRMLTSLQKPTSILTVNGSAAFGHPSRHLAERYLLKGGLHACHNNSKYALTAGRSDHALIWEIVAAMLSPKALENDMDVLTTIGRPPPLRSQRTLYSSSDQGILPRDMAILKDLFSALVDAREVQLIATLLLILVEHGAETVTYGSDEASNNRNQQKVIETDYFNSREPSRSRSVVNSDQPTPRASSPSPLGPYFAGLSSNFSQILPFSNSLASMPGSFGHRDRKGSDISAYIPDYDFEQGRPRPMPVPANLRRPTRSASPRRDSFRQQLFRKPSDSFSPDGISPASGSSLRSVPVDSSLGSSQSASGFKNPRVTFTPGIPSSMSKRSLSRHASVSHNPRHSKQRVWQIRGDVRSRENRVHIQEAWSNLFDPCGVILLYCDMLLRWQLHSCRNEFLSSSIMIAEELVSQQHNDLTALSVCTKCGYEIRDDSTQACTCRRAKLPSCAFCRLPIKGLAMVCTLCLHQTHAACAKVASTVTIAESADVTCSSGCDCSCNVSYGFNGTMQVDEAALTPVETSITSPREKVFANTPSNSLANESSVYGRQDPLPSRTLGMFAKAQIRHLTPDFSQYFSHAT